MSDSENRGYNPAEQRRKLTQAELDSIIAHSTDDPNSLTGFDLSDLVLAGDSFAGKSFRNCDVRGITLEPIEKNAAGVQIEMAPAIRNTDWTDAVFASGGDFTNFCGADAEGAHFGFTETLDARYTRLGLHYQKTGEGPTAEETGGFYNFDGSEANFRNTRWSHIHFGGGSGYEAFFPEADFTGAVFVECDLRGIDFSNTKLNDVKFIISDLDWTKSMIINEKQVNEVAMGVNFVTDEDNNTFAQILKQDGARSALANTLGIIIESRIGSDIPIKDLLNPKVKA